MKHSLVRVAFLLLCSCEHCPPIDPVVNKFQDAIDALNSGIGAITTQSDLWRAQLARLASDLQNDGMVRAAAFVRDTMDNGIARVGIEYRCNVDYTAKRIRDGLEQLKAAMLKVSGDAIPTETSHVAYICSQTPQEIAWQEAPSSVIFRGFDLSVNEITATIDAQTGESDITSALTWNNPYEVTINLASNGANFPRPCSRVKLYSHGANVGGVACTTKCPAAPPPITIPADRKQRRNVTGEANCCSYRYDEDYAIACDPGYVKETIEINRIAGRGQRHCGESNLSPDAGRYTTKWLSNDPTDCSFHAHAGVTASFRHYSRCQYIVWEIRPEQSIEQPKPVVGWCR